MEFKKNVSAIRYFGFRNLRIFIRLIICFFSLIGFSSCDPYSDEAQVQIVTGADLFKPFLSPPREIVYGPYSLKVTPDTAVIAWEEMRGREKLRHVEVYIVGLSPATEYVYCVNGAEKDGRLLTPPVDDSPFSFFIWGDSRTDSDTARQVADKMMEIDPDASFALHTGDFVLDGDSVECWESEWWGPMSDFMLYLPIYPIMGNHEANSEIYHRYFSALEGKGATYSFDWGGIHVVVLDSNRGQTGIDEQIEWLKADLQANMDADFIIAGHHLPAYASSTDGGNGSEMLQNTLVPIYEQYGVDLVISGDVHTYQHHLKNNIHYIISAGGGARLYDYGLPLGGMTMKLYKTFNFSHVLADSESINITTYDLEGNTLDSFEVVRGEPTDINSMIKVEIGTSEVTPGDQFLLDIFVQGVENLDKVSFTLAFYRDDPPIMLKVIDADMQIEGVQIEKGGLKGDVIVNQADNAQGIIKYQEENIGSFYSEMIKVASATFEVPEDVKVAALYLIPKFILFDMSGKKVPHFMGGVKVIIKR
ncbi:MAG: metallophosphoesterase [Thermodesulfobacteriota bacterium]|nr:metallophosphoesterase [Thermodesulfobacteriota bacterium]